MTERRKKKREETREYREVFKPKTDGHRDYVRCISENTVTFCTGPAGSSKSYTALGLASEYLLSKDYERIIIARPTVEASPKGLGFLPGGLNEKLSPYVQPAIEHLQRFLGKNTFLQMRAEGRICIEALEYLRGKTFNNCFIIGEEFQNASTEQIIMFVSRIGENSKLVVNGDGSQCDLHKYNDITDLEYVMNKIEKHQLNDFGVIRLNKQDIVRHPIIGTFLEIFDK